jgi:hypothetical protein
MRKSRAVEAFNKDFTEFQINQLILISTICKDIEIPLKKGCLNDFFKKQINDLIGDLGAIDANDVEKAGKSLREQNIAMTLCESWVDKNITQSSDLTLVAMTLWMHGPREGKKMLLDAANN